MVSTPAPKKRRGWFRAIAWMFGILVALLVVVYFVATSEAFFKGMILPRVGKAINAQVTVSDASISPFSQVVLRNLKVQTTGTEPLVSAAEVRLRYSLMDIIRSNIHVDEVALVSPAVVLVENPDGSSNLDPILKSLQAKPGEQKPAAPAQAPSAKPLQIDLKKFALTDATIRRVKNYANGTRDMDELSHVNITLDDLKNGQTGKLALGADINIVQQTNATLQAKLAGSFTLALTADLKPGAIKGSTHLDVTQAEGALADAAAFGSELNVEGTPTNIKEVALRFQKGRANLGELRVSGPFDMDKLEGRLSIVFTGIDKQLLNVAGARFGMDFGGTTISSTNDVALAKGGSLITAKGQVNVSNFQLTRTGQTTPRMDLRKDYDITVDRGQKIATLRTLTLTGSQNGNTFLKGELTSPMQIPLGTTKIALVDSTWTAAITGLNLADWKPFLGDVAPAGRVTLTAKVRSQQSDQQIALGLDSRIDSLTVNAGSNHIADVTLTLHASAQTADLKQFRLTDSKLEFAHQNETLTTVTASGTYHNDKKSADADVQVEIQAALAPLLRTAPQPGMAISSGAVELKAHITQKDKTQTVTGSLTLADFSGRFGKNELRSLGAAMDFDMGMTAQQARIRKLTGTLTQGTTVGGRFDVFGTYDWVKTNATFIAKLTDINQNGLGPFLQPALGDKKLVSVAINGNANAQYDPQGASVVKADFQITNLVVKDPAGQFPATPLEAKMKVDVSLHKRVADVRQFHVTLTPTSRATNQMQLSGRVDMSDTNGIQGNLKLVADSLDFTTYYDLFMGGKPTTATRPAPTSSRTGATPAPASALAEPNKEPAPIKLPLHNFNAEATIRRLYLHEMEVADWQTTVKIDGGHVVLNPFKLALNGSPVNTTLDMDLGVLGWKYDWSLSAQAIPLAPLVNSFQPDRKGQIGGTVSAQGHVTGAGIIGASLQKNLTGQFDMNMTNLSLNVINIKSPVLKTLVNVVASIPELVKNPTGTATSLISGLLGKAGTSGGLADDLQRSPIDSIVVRGAVSAGQVTLQQATVQNTAFRANATGTMTLASVLTNSALQIPVSVSLNQSIAQKLALASGTSAANAAYVKLPDFYTMEGTVGAPKNKINYLALAGTMGKSVTGAVQGLGGNVGGVLGNVLGSTSSTNPSGSKVGGLLQGILDNSVPPATTNQSPANRRLEGLLFGPKKK